MHATTEYGSYATTTGGSASRLRDAVAEVLGDYVGDYDVDALTMALRGAVNAALDGTGVTLNGDEFYGPVMPHLAEEEARALLAERVDLELPVSPMEAALAVAWDGFWDLAQAHEIGVSA